MSGKPIRAPTSLAPTSIIDGKAVLTGRHLITVSASTVIHPGARLISTYGAVTVGTGSIISSRVRLGHEILPTDSSNPSPNPDLASDSDDHHLLPTLDISIGSNVVLEPGAVVSCLMIGDGSVVGAGAVIGPGAVLGQHCRIAPRSVVRPGELLPDYSVVYGAGGAGRTVGAGGGGGGAGGRAGKGGGDGTRRRTQREGLEGLREAAHAKHVEALGRLIKSNLALHGGGTAAPAPAPSQS